MTQYFHSGTPKNDPFQWLENSFTHYRLFSIFGDYRKEVMRWLCDYKEGIDSVDAYLDRYPEQRPMIEAEDNVRRGRQREQGDERDFDTIEVLRAVSRDEDRTPTGRLHTVMLDSGAFSVWKSGGKITVDQVISAYAAFLDEAGDLFQRVWLVNLDEIPGKPKQPVEDRATLRRAAEIEDANLIVLRDKLARFEPHILPVIHQSRHEAFDRERLKEVLEQAAHSDHFLCVSPDNSRPEKERVAWARGIRDMAADFAPEVRLHGLATTGNVMANGFGFYSVDSLAWLQHALFGNLDLYETRQTRGGNEVTRYGSYHVGIENDAYDVLAKKHIPSRKQSYWNLTDEQRAFVREKCEPYPIPFEVVQWLPRARSLINVGELGCFMCWEGPRDLIPKAA